MTAGCFGSEASELTAVDGQVALVTSRHGRFPVCSQIPPSVPTISVGGLPGSESTALTRPARPEGSPTGVPLIDEPTGCHVPSSCPALAAAHRPKPRNAHPAAITRSRAPIIQPILLWRIGSVNSPRAGNDLQRDRS